MSVCASAYRVDNAAQAFERAAAFGFAPFSGKVGPNERVVPSVQAPDSSLQYFVDEAPGEPTLYETDFNLTDTGKTGRVDHPAPHRPRVPEPARRHAGYVGAVFQGHIRLRCRAVGAFAGPVRSRQKPRRAQPRRVGADRAERVGGPAYIGSGVVVDLSRFGIESRGFRNRRYFRRRCGSLREQGVPLLHIPRNYYDDLDARFGFDEAQLEQMREGGILYDRDSAGGEFFHVYTEQFAERFFLEVVRTPGRVRRLWRGERAGAACRSCPAARAGAPRKQSICVRRCRRV